MTDGQPLAADAAQHSPQPAPAPAAKADSGRLWLIGGGILLVCGLVLCLVPVFVEGRPLWPRLLGAAATLAGAWWLAAHQATGLRWLATLLGVLLAAVGFGLGWLWLGWFAAGAGAGTLCSWGYAKGHRGWWFTGALLVAGYLGSVAACLVSVATNGGIWWPFIQGLLTLIAGVLLVLWSREKTGPRRQLAGKAGRIAILIAACLPYAALLLVGIR